jgi:non-ribosomal peptide synthetase component E (peptide arylation enzyme)
LNIALYVTRFARRAPDQPALIFEERMLTYDELESARQTLQAQRRALSTLQASKRLHLRSRASEDYFWQDPEGGAA